MVDLLFRDRRHAGQELANKLANKLANELANELAPCAPHPHLLVLGLPRGGVPVAFEVANALHAPLDVLVVRKLGAPGQAEYAVGAIASGGVRVLDEGALRQLCIGAAELEAIVRHEEAELARREQLYRAGRAPLEVEGRTLLVVDDGLATGATMRAAVRALRARRPARIVVAVPVAAAETCAQLRREAHALVCVHAPEHFRAVSLWYEDFSQTSDEEVRELLVPGL